MTLTARRRLPILLVALAALVLSLIGAPVAAQDGSVPANPTGLAVASVSHNSVELEWDDPNDDSITHYQVLRRDRDVHALGEFITIDSDTGSDAASYTDDTVEPEKSYVYRVVAVNRHGASGWSGYSRADTPATPLGAGPLAGFTVVDASDQTAVGTLTDGDTLVLDDPDNGSYGVRADLESGEEIGSVRLELTGAKDVAQTENIAPYSLYGDDDDGLHGESLPAGEYTLTATAYAEARLGGAVLGTLAVSFTVTGPPPEEEDQNSPATGLVVITGNAYVGETLTADTSGISDDDGLGNPDYGYQWIRYDGTTDTDISGETDSTYTLVEDDEANAIKVRVSFTDDAGNPEELTSEATAFVAPPPEITPIEGEEPGTALQSVSSLVPVDWSLIPSGIGPGDKFRLMVVTSHGTITRANNSENTKDIADYNGYVTGSVEANSELAAYASGFRALVSTTGDSGADPAIPSADARDNTSSTYTDADTGVPIYWLGGRKVADDYADFYDGSWDSGSGRDHNGVSLSGNSLCAWTGSLNDGTGSHRRLGSTDFVTYGCAPNAGQEINKGIINGGSFGLYALSEVFEVSVPDYAVWSATLTVGFESETPDDFYGFMGSTGDLEPDNFTYDSSPVTVTELGYRGNTLHFDIGGGRDALGSGEFSLYVDGTYLRISNPAADVDGELTLQDHGLSWSDGDTVVVFLTENQEPSANPSVSGDPRFGEKLTADTSAITDPNGLHSPGYRYQWVLVDGASETVISGATESTYRPSAADVGKSLKVKVSFTDDAGFDEGPLTSEATAPVAPVAMTWVSSDWSLVPAGLVEGDRFRLLFASSDDRSARDSDIDDYNDWIQNQLADNGHTDIRVFSRLFRAVGSTNDADARDNTDTTYTDDDKGVRIYWLDGDKVADDYEDFYDGDWDDEENVRDEAGAAPASVGQLWTGSADDGTEAFQGGTSRALGNDGNNWVRQGSLNHATGGPLSHNTADRGGNKEMYGLSGVFEVADAPIEVAADWPLKPSGLGEGDQFRLLFISSVPRTAEATDIDTYNAWVQRLAGAGHTDIRSYLLYFRAVGSTEDVDARDNTGTTGTGVPIYWLGGDKAADNYGDFYNETWDEEASMRNESGTEESGVSAWTGSDHDGTEFFHTDNTSRALGNSNNAWVSFGKTDSAEHGPLSGETAGRTDKKRIYALSDVFTVVNTTATGKPAVVQSVLPPDEEVIWEGTITVGTDRFSGYHGFGYPAGSGTLSPAAFSWNGETVTVVELQYAGNPVGELTLRFDLEDEDDDWSALGSSAVNLYLDDKGFRIDDPGARTGKTYLRGHGLDWTKGQQVRARLTVAGGTALNPTLSRGAAVGEPLTVDLSTIDDPDGIPNVSEATIQWSADGVDIDGATDPAYRPLPADEGKRIAVTVSFTDGGGMDEGPLTSDPATVALSPLGDVIYSTVMTVEEDDLFGATHYGYSVEEQTGSLGVDTFTFNSVEFTVLDLYFADEDVGADGLSLGTDASLGDGIFFLHLNGKAFLFQGPPRDYTADFGYPYFDFHVTKPGLLWADGDEVEVRLVAAFNNEPTGAAEIVGDDPPQVGERLTADISSVMDDDGLPEPDEFSYQWVRVEADATEADIEGATLSSYAPLVADIGKSIKVRVSYTDDANFPESPTSEAAVVASPYGEVIWSATLTAGEGTSLNDTFFGFRSGVGSLDPESFTHNGNQIEVGRLLYVVGGEFQFNLDPGSDPLGSGDFNLYLVECDQSNNCEESRFLIEEPGEDHIFSFSEHGLSWSVGQEVEVWLTENRAPDGKPTITGTAEVGQTLTADASTITDPDGVSNATFTYQWVRSDGVTDEDINGATGSTYVLVAADGGRDIKVRVSYTDDANFQEELTSQATAVVASPYGEVIWSATLTAGEGTSLNDTFFGFRSGVGSLDPESFTHNGNQIEVGRLLYVVGGEFQFNLDPGSDPLGSGDFNLYLVECDQSNNCEESRFLIEEPGEDHIFSFSEHGLSWSVGQEVEVWLTENRAPDGKPTITGTAEVGQTLTADASTITDPDGVSNATFTYQWVRSDGVTDEDINGATGSTYVLVAADGGRDIKVRVSYTDDANFPESPTSDPVGPVLDTGVTLVNDTWSLIPSGLSEGAKFRLLFISSAHRTAEAANIATYNAWVQDQAAAGHKDIQDYSSVFRALGSSEDINALDNTVTTGTGVAIYWLGGNKVADNYGDFYDESWDEEASMTNESGTAESGSSAWTGSDHDGTEYFTSGNSRALGNSSDFVRFGKTNSNDHSPISGGTANKTDNRRIYGLSGVFQVSANTPATGEATISGTPQVGEVLTAETSAIMDAEGVTNATFSYQWVSYDGTDDTDISGATESTYWPSAGDVGKTIKVKVSFTDDEGNAEELTSEATDTVVAVPVTAVPADWSLTPSGLGTGERFRLLFVSSAERNAVPTDIDTYNTWIQDLAAAGHTDIQDYSSYFRVVGSTEDVDARDNTGSTYTSTDKGVPIHWLGGDKAADEYEDFYDGSWDQEATMRTQAGATVSAPTSVWTGSNHNGTESFSGVSLALGSQSVGAGKPNSAVSGYGPLTGGFGDQANSYPVYGLSGVFSVSPPGEIVWSASMTVEEQVSLLNETWLGYYPFEDQGSLEPNAFSYGGSEIDVLELEYQVGGALILEIGDHSDLGSGNFNLYLDGSAFLIEDPASDSGGIFEFSNHGLSWTNGQIVRVWLTENREPTLTISGTTLVEQTLTAVIDEPDGLPAADQITYQWIRVDGGTETDISGATGSTYKLVDDDEDKTIKVQVSYTDNANFAESLTSDATAIVTSGPAVASVTVSNITQTTADVTVAVANLQNVQHTVHLRYRQSGATIWNTGYTTSTTGDDVEFDLIGLDGNTDYDVQASLDSNFVDGVVEEDFKTGPVEPGRLTYLLLTAGDHRLVSFWDAPGDDGGSPVTGYVVQWKGPGQDYDSSRQATPTGFGYTITGLTNGVEYSVRVVAVNAVGQGPWWSTEKGIPFGPPPAPTNVAAGAGDEKLTVTWSQPNDGGSAITAYTVQWKSGTQGWSSSRQGSATPPDRSLTITGLDNDTEYTVRVQATNTHGDGDWSDEKKGTPREGPAVSLVRVKEPISCAVSSIELEFVALEPEKSYHAHLRFRAQDSGGSWTVLWPQEFWSSSAVAGAAAGELNGAAPTFTLPFLDYGTTYEVQAALDSGFVDGLSTTVFTTPALSEVGLLPLSEGNTMLGLRWNEPTSKGQVTGYLVQWKSGDEEYDGTDTSERQADVPGSGDGEHDITGLDNGVEYTVRVMAYNDNGVGVPSSEVKGTPLAPNSPARGAPTISGTARVGETLTADISGIADDDGMGNPTFAYQWLANDADIAGATDSSYTPEDADEGKAIRVKVSFTDDRDFEETLISEATAAVAPAADESSTWSAKLTVGNYSDSFLGYWDGFVGELAPAKFNLDGKEYTVKKLIEYPGDYFTVMFDQAIPINFTLRVGAVTFLSEEADQGSTGTYIWNNQLANLSEGDTVEVSLTESSD